MKNLKLYLIVVFLGSLFMIGCEYAFVEYEEVDPPTPDPDNPVSFATQIVPIFTSRCIDCHDTGGTAPDLTAANAYQSLSSMDLINTANPEESKIYEYVTLPAPDHAWRTYTTAQASLVLLWIQEGALNN